MMTPAQLAAELNRRGFDLKERKLRAWRKDGLLPELDNYGQGRAMGILRVWKDDNILERAITAYELLSVRRDVESAMLGIWFCGYEVDIAKIRNAWSASIRNTEMLFVGKASSKDAKEDALGALAQKISPELARDTDIRLDAAKDLLTEGLNALFNSVEIACDEGIALTAKSLFKRKTDGAGVLRQLDSKQMNDFLRYARQNFSIDALQQLIASSTDDEIKLAHSRWCQAMHVLGRLCLRVNYSGSQDELLLIERTLKATFGGLFILAMLIASRNGYGSQIDEYIRLSDSSDSTVN